MVPFDSVITPCPKCGYKQTISSLSGQCLMMTYPLDEAPADVLHDLTTMLHIKCPECDIKFTFKRFDDGQVRAVEYTGKEEGA